MLVLSVPDVDAIPFGSVTMGILSSSPDELLVKEDEEKGDSLVFTPLVEEKFPFGFGFGFNTTGILSTSLIVVSGANEEVERCPDDVLVGREGLVRESSPSP